MAFILVALISLLVTSISVREAKGGAEGVFFGVFISLIVTVFVGGFALGMTITETYTNVYIRETEPVPVEKGSKVLLTTGASSEKGIYFSWYEEKKDGSLRKRVAKQTEAILVVRSVPSNSRPRVVRELFDLHEDTLPIVSPFDWASDVDLTDVYKFTFYIPEGTLYSDTPAKKIQSNRVRGLYGIKG